MSTASIAPIVAELEQRFQATWDRTDRIFGLVAADAWLDRPIRLRHPFIFYVGHLPAFAWKQVCRGVLGRAPFDARLDEMFDRGIDPDVDDPTRCHAHPAVPDEWPQLERVLSYRDRVRRELLRSIHDVVTAASTTVMAVNARALMMALEHEQMHQETLLYIVQQLPAERKVRPRLPAVYPERDALRCRTIPIPRGTATLGADFEAMDFGWDNEFPSITVTVPEFVIDSTPVTNAEFLEFVAAGGYGRRELWDEADWSWKEQAGLYHPMVWTRRDGVWRYRTVLDELAFVTARDWPVYVSLAEARAFARWRDARLPTEAEFHRAAYGTPSGAEQSFPWGDEPPRPEHGNFHFAYWSPVPVGSHPAGACAWGVHELVGNGWEWTQTAFTPFLGFEPYIPTYPGYSADLFDGKHYVLKGASWASDAQLVRRSFRNWYQARYPYVFAKFRCVR